MWIRSLMLMFAVGCAAVGDTTTNEATDELSGPVDTAKSNNFHCSKNIVLGLVNIGCIGSVVAFGNITVPVIVTVANNLNNNQVNVLTDNLNHVAIADQNKVLVNILDDLAAAAAVFGDACATGLGITSCHQKS